MGHFVGQRGEGVCIQRLQIRGCEQRVGNFLASCGNVTAGVYIMQNNLVGGGGGGYEKGGLGGKK